MSKPKRTLRELLPVIEFGGREDLLTAGSIAAGLTLANPGIASLASSFVSSLSASAPIASAISSGVIGASAMGLSAAGAWRLGRTMREVALSPRRAHESKVNILSDVDLPSPARWNDWDGMMLGYDVVTGRPVTVDWEHWMRHALIAGQSGVGKTVLAEWVTLQQIARGGGVVFVDGKIDSDNLQKIYAMACWAGRAADLRVIHAGDPNLSNTYNPVLFGDPDEIASRVLSLIPASEGSPGTDYYRQAANQAIATLVNAFNDIPANQHIAGMRGIGYNFLDLAIALQSPAAMMHLERQVNLDSEGGRMFKLWLDQFKVASREAGGNPTLDMKKMRDLFGGIGGRLYGFGTGSFGQFTNTYSPECNLFEDIMANRIIYVALPTMGKAEAASNFGKMFTGDYRTAISWIQQLPKHMRPWPPTLGLFDEPGSYATQSWARMFEQGRSAHQALVPAIQTIANLDSVSPEFRSMVVGNTWTKIFFKLGEEETVAAGSAMFGEEEAMAYSVSSSRSSATGASEGQLSTANRTRSDGMGITKRSERVPRVHPTTFQKLGKGEALVLYGNSQIYHIKIPKFDFTADFYKSIGQYAVNRLATPTVKGLDFYKNPQRWTSSESQGGTSLRGAGRGLSPL